MRIIQELNQELDFQAIPMGVVISLSGNNKLVITHQELFKMGVEWESMFSQDKPVTAGAQIGPDVSAKEDKPLPSKEELGKRSAGGPTAVSGLNLGDSFKNTSSSSTDGKQRIAGVESVDLAKETAKAGIAVGVTRR